MSNSVENKPPTPLTILTGFLGAGKTTLLNHILHADHGLKVAVLVNDFGAINIDTGLVAGAADDVVSLANGCICCTMRDDLLLAVLGILERSADIEYIIIEASGVSDPLEIAYTFMLPELRPLVRLDSIICVADAEQSRQKDHYAELIEHQIASSDIVLLNKADLVSAEKLADAREWIRTLAPCARVLETMAARAPLGLLLAVGSYRLPLDADPSTAQDHQHGGHEDHAEGEEHGAHEEHEHHHHDEDFSSWSYNSERPFALKPLRDALDRLPETIFRAKGVLAVAEIPARRTIFQLVGRRVALTVGELWGMEPPRSQLVTIGLPGSLDEEQLRQLFDSCLAGELSAAAG